MAAPGAAGTATEFSSEKLSLAMIILGEQFGDIVQAVGAAMLRRGQMTLTDLVSASGCRWHGRAAVVCMGAAAGCLCCMVV
jgi:hypothetical protein